MTNKSSNGRTAWVCKACFATSSGRDAGALGVDFDLPPLGLVRPGTTVVAGILADEHECEDRWVGHRPVIGCGEEERDYETDPCDGCGSDAAGPRHALTLWSLGNWEPA